MDRTATVEFDAGARRGWKRKRNRRVAIQRRAPTVVVADGVSSVLRGLLRPLRVLAKVLLVLAVLVGGAFALVKAGQHVLASPRFALQSIVVTPTRHVTRDEILLLAEVSEGDRLLAIDTDAVAARIASHPWIEGARVRRQLPSAISLEIEEHRAVAVAALGGLYLLDEQGRAFKRATMDEADGLPVLTGIDRTTFHMARDASEAAFREAMVAISAWNANANRPALSELNIDPRFGFTLFLVDGGTELRLGRGNYGKKLARFDRILEAVIAGGVDGGRVIRIVHLDGTDERRVPAKLNLPNPDGGAPRGAHTQN